MGEYRRSEKTRRSIYRAAHELFVEKGYEETSLIDIAARAHVSTGTVYRHYPAKSYLLLYSSHDEVVRLKGVEEEFPDGMGCVEKLRVLMETGIADSLSVGLEPEGVSESAPHAHIARGLHLAHRSAMYSTIDSLSYAYTKRSEMRDLLEKTLEEGIDRSEVARDVDAHDLADVLVAMYFRQCDLALLDPEGEGSLDAFRHKADTILRLLTP